MLGILLCCAAVWPSALTMPNEPIALEFQRGAALAASGRPIDRTFGNDRKTLGTWFDGAVRQPTEYAVRFSPAFISRWLGYLDQAEAWPVHEPQRRWDALRRELDGKIAFLVALSAFPKTSTLDLIEPAPADVSNLGRSGAADPGVGFVLAAGDHRFETVSRKIAYWQARSREQIVAYRWWLDVPFGGWLTPRHMRDQMTPPYALGDWFGAWYYVEAPLMPEMHEHPLILRVLGPSKQRRAEWPAPTEPTTPSDPKARARPASAPRA